MKASRGVVLILCSMLIGLGIGVSASVAQVSFNKGELDATCAAPFDKTWKAAHDGLMDIDWIWVHKTQRDSTEGIIEAWGKAIHLSLLP
jgi:hypothetical protein